MKVLLVSALVGVALLSVSSAFTAPLLSPQPRAVTRTVSPRSSVHKQPSPWSSRRVPSCATTTSLSTLPSSVLSSPLIQRPAVRLSLLFAAALAFLVNARRILYPHVVRDKKYKEPLPPGSLGCPFFGKPFFLGSKDYGPGAFYMKQVKRLANHGKGVFKYYFMGTPFACVNGEEVKDVLSSEFTPNGIETLSTRGQGGNLMGTDSLTSEGERDRHTFLRKLVGQAITPQAVAKSVPSLQQAAEKQADKMLETDGPIKMEDVCTDFTLDVAWRQILGLDLVGDEIPRFHVAVDEWISGLTSLRNLFNIFVESTKAYKARMYLEGLIEDKVIDLEKNGPDDSTLSGMVYAADEDDPSRKLTRREIIDNAMLLIIAGSETSSSTLTNAMLFMGLHPDSWKKLVDEQKEMQAKHGDALDKNTLDKECPYLEAVIKETMRLKPISGGIPRRTKETMIIDGKQIPKGWLVDWNPILTHYNDPKVYKSDGSHMDIKKGFVPERWLSEETTPSLFIAMGAGPRYCLGSNLAYVEMKVFLAVMARRFSSFHLVGETKDGEVEWRPMGIIPQPKDGALLTVEAEKAFPALA